MTAKDQESIFHCGGDITGFIQSVIEFWGEGPAPVICIKDKGWRDLGLFQRLSKGNVWSGTNKQMNFTKLLVTWDSFMLTVEFQLSVISSQGYRRT